MKLGDVIATIGLLILVGLILRYGKTANEILYTSVRGGSRIIRDLQLRD